MITISSAQKLEYAKLMVEKTIFTEPYRSTLKAIIQKVGYDYDIDVVELEVPKDHAHMVIERIPKQSLSAVMQIVKRALL